MSPAQSIIIGACIIAGSILFINSIHPAEAQRIGPFQLMHHSNTSANAGVFRLDTATGDVSFCYIASPTSADITCTKSAR